MRRGALLTGGGNPSATSSSPFATAPRARQLLLGSSRIRAAATSRGGEGGISSSSSSSQWDERPRPERRHEKAAAAAATTAPEPAAASLSSPRPAAAPQAATTTTNSTLAAWALAAALAATPFTPLALDPAFAAGAPKADTAAVGKCLLSRCQGALAGCLADSGCAKNLVCLNACSLNAKDGDDETACQIRCGDRYGDAAVEAFNTCAVSQGRCVPQRADEGLFPIPPECSLDKAFDLSRFTGRWYITAGLNDLFDTFDCQVHYFATPGPTTLAGKLNWRIGIPGGDFLERSTVQTFVQPQPAENPAILLNHGNEILHYEDDWYVLASKPDEYVFVYYRGNNDAWSGYGGAFVYTKAASLPAEYIPELEKAAAAAGLKWSDFKLTDNTCGPHPPRAPSLGAQVAREIGRDARAVEGSLEGALKSFGRGFTRIERSVGRELTESERLIEKELQDAERLVEEVERSFVAEEREVVADVGAFFRRVFGGGGGGKK